MEELHRLAEEEEEDERPLELLRLRWGADRGMDMFHKQPRSATIGGTA